MADSSPQDPNPDSRILPTSPQSPDLSIPIKADPDNDAANDPDPSSSTIPSTAELKSSAQEEAGADADTSMTGLDGTSDQRPSPSNRARIPETQDPNMPSVQPQPQETEVEPRIPQKKDATLREFLGKMDDYAPIIPDAITAHYLTLAGLPPPPATPPHLARLLALATQKFVADIAADAYQYARIRSGHTTSNTAAASAMMGAGLGLPGQPGAAGGAGAQGKEDKGKGGAATGVGLGTQRPGYGGGGAGGQSGAAGGAGGGRTVLTMEDLGCAVGEYGVNVRRGEFYR